MDPKYKKPIKLEIGKRKASSTTESTADIYTREKRKVVQRSWTAAADKLGKLDLTGGKNPDVLELDPSAPQSSPEKPSSPPFKSRRQALAEKQAASPDPSAGSWQKVNWPPHLPETTSQGDSLRVASASKGNRSTGLMNIHLLNRDGKAVCCGWQPSASKALGLNSDDYHQEPHKYVPQITWLSHQIAGHRCEWRQLVPQTQTQRPWASTAWEASPGSCRAGFRLGRNFWLAWGVNLVSLGA